MNEMSPAGCCERSANWLREAREVRRIFESPDVTRDVEVSARLRLTMLGQRLVLHTCEPAAVAV
ncbi:MAG: hypothetical protein R3C39_10135 [Dehalococcoidia bacterium]